MELGTFASSYLAQTTSLQVTKDSMHDEGDDQDDQTVELTMTRLRSSSSPADGPVVRIGPSSVAESTSTTNTDGGGSDGESAESGEAVFNALRYE